MCWWIKTVGGGLRIGGLRFGLILDAIDVSWSHFGREILPELGTDISTSIETDSMVISWNTITGLL